jgi:hypothetical protein
MSPERPDTRRSIDRLLRASLRFLAAVLDEEAEGDDLWERGTLMEREELDKAIVDYCVSNVSLVQHIVNKIDELRENDGDS